MPKFQIHYKTDVQSELWFDGVIEPDGSTGYKFSGTLTACCKLDRSSFNFDNIVRFQHGGSASSYNDIEFTLVGGGNNKFEVKGSGTREPNDTVDFRIGFNEGTEGQFHDRSLSYRKNVTPGGPWQEIAASYLLRDSYGETKYDVRFNGRARADGPDGYVMEGTLDAYEGPGAMTPQYAKLCYGSQSEPWSNKTEKCKDTPVDYVLSGSRKPGDKLQVQVGATSKVFNLYEYGSEIRCELPDNF